MPDQDDGTMGLGLYLFPQGWIILHIAPDLIDADPVRLGIFSCEFVTQCVHERLGIRKLGINDIDGFAVQGVRPGGHGDPLNGWHDPPGIHDGDLFFSSVRGIEQLGG